MRGTTHALTGATTWTAACALVPHVSLTGFGVGLAAATIAALVPDLDTVGSTAARAGGPLTWLLAVVVRGVSGGHRKGTHSLAGLTIWAGVLCAVNAYLAESWTIVVALITGYAVHLAGDMLTRNGVPLLWPSLRCFWLLPYSWRFTTGGRRHIVDGRVAYHGPPVGETIVAGIALLGVVVAAVARSRGLTL